MSFNAAELVATIRLDGAQKVGRDLTGVRTQLNQADAAVAKVTKGAKAAFEGAAVGIGTASVAATVFIAKLASTGVAYNQLQQTSRAALSTLLGGAEAANAQMDKLDAFAKKSPFSKSVFISAQQQLIGFGFEAQKVIPILTSVSNAVAAVGGSNQQISEIVSILAKIRSSGKLTAEDLNMLGERGLDAATLLGQGFGKSAAEIRESITEGTLDAGEAVDVLVAQMDTKFAGAADNVKNTFAGTTDRIKAASRDIGSALAEPFVSRNGGGLAVTWGNQVADVLRGVESHIPPIVSILTSRAAPAFADITELLDRARVQVRSWDSSRIENGLDAIADHGPAIAAVAGAVIGVNSGILRGIPIVGQFIPAISPLAGILAGAALASPELRDALGELLGEMRPLVPVAVELAGVVSGALNAALPITADAIGLVTAVARPFVDILESIPSPMLATIAATIGVASALRAGAPTIQGWVDGVRRIADQVAVQAALAGMEGNTSRLAGTFGVAGRAASGLSNSLKAAFISNPVGLIILGLSTAAAILTSAFMAQADAAQQNTEQITSYRDSLDQATGAVLRATRAEAEKALADAGALDAAEKLGLSRLTAIDAVFGEEAAMRAVSAAYREYAGTVQKDGITQAKEFNTEAGLLNSTVMEQRRLVAEAQEELRLDAEAKREAASASSELERSNTRMNEALAIARDVSRDATERLKALKLALDEMKGGAQSQAEVTRNLHEQTDRLSEAFAVADENGNKLAGGLVNSAGAIDTTTAAGRALFDETSRLNDQMLDAILLADKEAKARGKAGVSLETSRTIAERYQGTLRGIATEAGLSDEQVNGLITTMLATPEVVAYAVDDGGTVDANKLRLVDLATQIIGTPDKQFEVSSDDFPGLAQALSELGVDITTLPEGQVKVRKDDGSFLSVQQSLDALTRGRVVTINTAIGTARYDPNSDSLIPGRAGGGPVQGPGTSTSDSILARLSNDEHVWTASETRALGGHAEMARLRAAVRSGQFQLPAFRDGGAVRIGVRSDMLPASQPITLRSAVRTVATVAAPGDDRARVEFRQEFSGPMYSYDPHDIARVAEEQKWKALAVAGLLGKV